MSLDIDATPNGAMRVEEKPIGLSVKSWKPAAVPNNHPLNGSFVRLDRLDVYLHAKDLFEANSLDSEGTNWLYLPYGPFTDFDTYAEWLSEVAKASDPHFYAVIDLITERAVGVASYLNIVPEHGRIEVGHIHYSPLLQQSTSATEAMYLMMKNAFDLGYRRYEWKCDSLNGPSRNAASRLGFTFEGIHRQHVISKGRNRDTAWFSVIDSEWPRIAGEFERWFSPDNFDNEGHQQSSLAIALNAGRK